MYPAVDGYDPNKSRFLTYYEYHFKSTIREALRDSNASGGSGISYNLYALIRKYDSYINYYECEHGRKPSVQHICEALGLTADKVSEIRKAKRALTESRSIDEPIPGSDDLILADTITGDEDIESLILDSIERSEIEQEIKEALLLLPDDIRRIIMLYYIQGLPSDQILKMTGILYWEFSNKRNKGLSLLRRDARIKRRIRDYEAELSPYRCSKSRFDNRGSEVERMAVDMVYYERKLQYKGTNPPEGQKDT